MEIYIAVGAFVLVAVLYLFSAYIHFPKERCSESEEVKALIMSEGLIHFTTIENAKKIQEDGLKPIKKAMYSSERKFVWMYINIMDDFQKNLNMIRKKGKRREYNAVVLFENVTESQINQMKYRKKDMAVIYPGEFRTDTISVQELNDALSSLNNK